MEVAVFISLDARLKNQSVFKRQVLVPDTFEFDSFVRVMRSIFGEKCIIEFLIV